MPPSANRRLLLEVCVDSLESAKVAVQNGADRLEICGSLGLGGGLTPSVSFVKLVQQAFPSTPLMVMVRPRCGDFVYSEDELSVMRGDIQLVSLHVPQVAGFVFGCLTAQGQVDKAAMKTLIQACEDAARLAMRKKRAEITFHRAFDMLDRLGKNGREDRFDAMVQAMSTLGKLGVERVLTSGLSPSLTSPRAAYWVGTLARLRSESNPTWPELLPGSGINAWSLFDLSTSPHTAFGAALRKGQIEDLHASCSEWVDGPVEGHARKGGMGMGVDVGGVGEWGRWKVKSSKVVALRGVMDEFDGD